MGSASRIAHATVPGSLIRSRCGGHARDAPGYMHAVHSDPLLNFESTSKVLGFGTFFPMAAVYVVFDCGQDGVRPLHPAGGTT